MVLTGGLDSLIVGVISLAVRLCLGETGGEEEVLEPKLATESGLFNMSGMRPWGMFDGDLLI